jgi:hypothetical protein
MKKGIISIMFLISFLIIFLASSFDSSASLTGRVTSGTTVSFSCTASSPVNSIWLVRGTGSSRVVRNIATSTSSISQGSDTIDLRTSGSHFVTCWGVIGTGSNRVVRWLGETTVTIGSSTTPPPSPTPTMGAVDIRIYDQRYDPYTYSDNVRMTITADNWGPLTMRYRPDSTEYMRVSLESGRSYRVRLEHGSTVSNRLLPFIDTKKIEKVSFQLTRE